MGNPRQPVNSKGLGLAIARQVALAHAGELQFSGGCPGEGFTIGQRDGDGPSQVQGDR